MASVFNQWRWSRQASVHNQGWISPPVRASASDIQAASAPSVDTPLEACEEPDGYVANNTDCDDSVTSTNPAALDTCNGVDDDCDGTTDNSPDNPIWYADTDGDGFGVESDTRVICEQPDGYADSAGDCSPNNADIHPAATELCNNYDDNCDDIIDTDAEDRTPWYLDSDGDGYGSPNIVRNRCNEPEGGPWSTNGDDCDPSDPTVYPGAEELPDDIDQDCDGSIEDAIEPDTDVDTEAPPEEATGCQSIPAPVTFGPLAFLALMVGRRRSKK